MTNQKCIFPKVLVSVVGIRLQGFGLHAFTQVEHLEHLLFSEAATVTVVWVWIWQRLERCIIGDIVWRHWPSLAAAVVFLEITWLKS